MARPVTGCNVVDALRSRPVRIVKMVPGGNVATGGLDCGLTLEIEGPPEGADPLSLRVRFESPALVPPTPSPARRAGCSRACA